MSFPKHRSTASETDCGGGGGGGADDEEQALIRGGGGGGTTTSTSTTMGVFEMEGSYSSYSSKTHKRLRNRCLFFLRRHRLYLCFLTAAVIIGCIALASFEKNNNNLAKFHLKEAKALKPSKSCTPFLLDKLDLFFYAMDTQPQKERCSSLFVPKEALALQLQQQEQQQSNGPPPCLCMNPVQGSMPDQAQWNASWQVAFRNNLQLVQQERTSPSHKKNNKQQLDVVLLGDSITEAWRGTSMGLASEKYQGNARVYKQLFDSDTAPVQGLALGISGDRCPQLLYRLQNGEIDGLYPKVFWILIGTNDFLKTACHVGEVAAGNIRIVHELLMQRPDATVVIQSLLPVGDPDNNNNIRHWQAYSAINERLACYASTVTASNLARRRAGSSSKIAADIQPKVHFVNVTQLFLTPQNTINTTLLPDGLHPSGLAASLWGQVIVQKVRELIDADSNNKKA